MRVVLTGASGQLGAYVLGRLTANGHEVSAWSGSDSGERLGHPLRPVDLADPDAVDRALAEFDPGLVVHAGAVSSAEAVRRDPGRARLVNVEATARLAGWCVAHGRRVVYTSTDMVFDGTRAWSTEGDRAAPVLAYGRTKLDAEAAVLAAPGGLVARLCLLFGPSRSGRPSFLDEALAALRRGEPRTFFGDEYRTPMGLDAAASALAGLADRGASGLVHVGGRERVSRFDLARRAASALGLDESLVRANRQADAPGPEPRPADVSLATDRLDAWLPGLDRPAVEEAVRRAWG